MCPRKMPVGTDPAVPSAGTSKPELSFSLLLQHATRLYGFNTSLFSHSPEGWPSRLSIPDSIWAPDPRGSRTVPPAEARGASRCRAPSRFWGLRASLDPWPQRSFLGLHGRVAFSSVRVQPPSASLSQGHLGLHLGHAWAILGTVPILRALVIPSAVSFFTL